MMKSLEQMQRICPLATNTRGNGLSNWATGWMTQELNHQKYELEISSRRVSFNSLNIQEGKPRWNFSAILKLVFVFIIFRTLKIMVYLPKFQHSLTKDRKMYV